MDMGQYGKKIEEFLESKGEVIQRLSISTKELEDNYLIDKDGVITLVPKIGGQVLNKWYKSRKCNTNSLLFSRTPFAIDEALEQVNLIFLSMDPCALIPRTNYSHYLDTISLNFYTYPLLQPSVDSTIIDLQVPVESTEPAARNGRDGPNLLP